jgi:hypothetical protein
VRNGSSQRPGKKGSSTAKIGLIQKKCHGQLGLKNLTTIVLRGIAGADELSQDQMYCGQGGCQLLKRLVAKRSVK